MAYKKYDAYHLGMTGDEVKEALENGGGGGGTGLTIIGAHESEDTFHLVLEKTFSEILEIGPENCIISETRSDGKNIFHITGIDNYSSYYQVYAFGGRTTNSLVFSAATVSDYPQADID